MLSRFIERIRKSRRRGYGLDRQPGSRQRRLTAESLEDRRLLALLTNSPGDATLDVDVDGFGGFDSAFYDPVGTPTRGDTTFDSFVAIGAGGARTSPTGSITSATDTEVRSTANYLGIDFEIIQTISPLTEGNSRVGTVLTQTYLMTNMSDQDVDFEIVRYIDGDLYLTNTSLADGGGRTVVDGHDILFETDGVIQSTDVDTFLGIAAEGGTVPTRNRFEISSFSGLLGTVNSGGALDDQVQGAPNNESFITSAYDVTMALRNEYTLAPDEGAFYVTWTFFGTLSPDAIQVPTGGSVTGTKFNDANADGVRDEAAGEAGLAGWTIYLDANDNGEFDTDELSTTTDSEGVYVFDNVEPGDYQVREVQQTGWTQYLPAANGGHDVTVTLGTVATGRDFGNRFDGATISGVKFMDLNGNRVQEESAGEIGLVGWTIWADLDDDGNLTAADARDVTRADGSYNLTVPPGNYAIREVEQPNWTQTAPSGGSYRQDFEALTAYPGFDFGNDPEPLIVTGLKWNDLNGNGEKNASEEPFAGVKIFADLNEDGLLDSGEPWVESGADGTYRLEVDFGPGTFRIAEEPSSSYDQTFPDPNVTGYYLIVGEPGDEFANLNFGNQLKPGSITGVKWNDLNGNGVRDSDASGSLEPGLGGVTIYIDLNNDQQLSVGEPATTTAPNGSYRLINLQPGEYYVREDARSGSSQTYPDPAVNEGAHHVTVSANTTTPNVGFGNQPQYDYGDAPSSYSTTGSGAAVHKVLWAYYLGATVDGEADGQPGPLALGDNVNGLNDEDGVRFVTDIVPGQTATLEVTLTQEGTLLGRPPQGYLQGWFDFDGDGSFTGAGEQVFTNRTLSIGVNSLTVSIPAGATTGDTFARFRLGLERNLGFGGASDGGEVEDYQVTIRAASSEITSVIGRDASTDDWIRSVNTDSGLVNEAWGSWRDLGPMSDVVTGDFTGDGIVDVAGRDASGAWWVGRNTATGIVNERWGQWSPDVVWEYVSTGHLNGDNRADIVGRTATGTWWVAYSFGTRFANSFLTRWSPSTDWHDVMVGNFSTGGFDEILGRTDAGSWWMATKRGPRMVNQLVGRWSTGTEWHDVMSGDFDDDGYLDVLGRSDTGNWHLARNQLSQGRGFVNQPWGRWDSSTAWETVLSGYFNNDGVLDILGRSDAGSWWLGRNDLAQEQFVSEPFGRWDSTTTWHDLIVHRFNGDQLDDVLGRNDSGEWMLGLNDGSQLQSQVWGEWDGTGPWEDVFLAIFP